MKKECLYFDNNATTRLAPEAFAEMLPFYREEFGNPSCVHQKGRFAKNAVTLAREKVAATLNTKPNEIIFTSSGSESDNLAIQGVINSYGISRVITTEVEHPAVYNLCMKLKERGCDIHFLKVGKKGEIDLDELKKEVSKGKSLVSVMMANNETGVIFPVGEISEIVKSEKGLFHIDGVQAMGKIDIDLAKLGVDLFSLSAHKFHGPKGIGILYKKEGIKLSPMVYGGGQEGGFRSGTENTVGIIGTAKALELAGMEDRAVLNELRVAFWKGVNSEIDGIDLNGSLENTLPNTLNIFIEGVKGELLVIKSDLLGMCISSGSACHSGAQTGSRVLLNMGFDSNRAESSVRISFSRYNTLEEVKLGVKIFVDAIRSIRKEQR